MYAYLLHSDSCCHIRQMPSWWTSRCSRLLVCPAFWKSTALLQLHRAGRRTSQSQHELWHCISCKHRAYTEPSSSGSPNSLGRSLGMGWSLTVFHEGLEDQRWASGITAEPLSLRQYTRCQYSLIIRLSHYSSRKIFHLFNFHRCRPPTKYFYWRKFPNLR